MDPTLIAILIPLLLIAGIVAIAIRNRKVRAPGDRSARNDAHDGASGGDGGILLWTTADSGNNSGAGASGDGGGDFGGGGASGDW